MWLPDPRPKLSQGDLLDGVLVWEPDGKQSQPRRIRVAILSNDCEIDKPRERGRFALVVEAQTPESAGDGWGNIQLGKGFNALHLPAGEGIAEGYLNLGRVYRVEKGALEEALQDGRRLGSMTDEGRELLVYAFTSYLLHNDIPPPAHP
jgi:hypothetical protein